VPRLDTYHATYLLPKTTQPCFRRLNATMGRLRKNTLESWPSTDTMASLAPMSPTKSIRPGSRDTGFPEPFNGSRLLQSAFWRRPPPQAPTKLGRTPQSRSDLRLIASVTPANKDLYFILARNTTLPHPEADLSPNACISADDISVHKVMHRSRRSFLAKHKRTTSYGKILPEHEKMYSDSAVILDSEGESSSSPSMPSMPSHDTATTSAPAGLGTSLMASSSRISKDSYPQTLSSMGDDDLKSAPESPRRRGIFGRLGLSSK